MPKNTTGLVRLNGLLLVLLLSIHFAFAQGKVTGRVINQADNQPVPGATITLRGTGVIAQSGADGSFSISLPSGSGTLLITAVGFVNLERPVSAGTVLGDVSLTAAPATLSDVVVTGYTAQRKKDITGSVSVVNVADMKSVPTGSTESLLQGQASGVTVNNSGQPGGYSNVHIRGITSFGNTDPLVIIDGTPGYLHDINVNDIQSVQVLKDAGAASIYGVRGSNGVIIVTTKKGRTGKVTVNYDGYVGTQRPLKKGWGGLANPTLYGQALWQTYLNDGLTPSNKQYGNGTQPVVPDYLIPTGAASGSPKTDPSTYHLFTNQITQANKAGNDWYHDIFHPVTIWSQNISASGGSDRSTYFYSFNYTDQPGTLIYTSLKRYSARINSTYSFLDNRVRIGENAFVVYKSNPGYQNLAGVNNANAIGASYQIPTIIPVHDIKGNYAGGLGGGLGNAPNPVAIQERQRNNVNNEYTITGNVFAEVDFLKHFTAHTQVGGMVDNFYHNAFLYTSYENAENNTNANSYQEIYGWNTSLAWTSTLKYSNTFGKHNLNLLGGTEYISNQGRASQSSRGNYYITDSSSLTVNPNLWTLNAGNASTQTNQNPAIFLNNVLTPTPYQSNIYSLFGRLDYNFDDKYLISATVRRDGSSVFTTGQRYGIFPSISAAWRISREKFLQNVDWINDLKIRGGWGKMGSISNINPTNPYSLYGQVANQSTYDINGSSTSATAGIANIQYGNPGTTWERDQLTNVGLDATILNDRIDISIEWYNKLISGLINQVTAPGTAGTATATAAGPVLPYINSGDITNHGIDLSITYHGAAVGGQLKYDLTGTFTSYVNMVKSLPPGETYIPVYNGATQQSRLQPGHPVGAFYGYQVIGLFQNYDDVNKSARQDGAAPGRFKYADVNHDGKITDSDRTFFGNPNPKFTAGLNIGLNYKHFDLFMLLYTSIGNKVLNGVKGSTDFPQRFGNAMSVRVATQSARLVNSSGTATNVNDPTAHVANPGTTVPMLEQSANFSNSTPFNSYTMESGSFLRCRTLTLGYTFDNGALRALHLDRVRLYGQVLNLFTITKYDGQDPEVLGSNTLFGIDGGAYPNNQKQYTIGINVSLH